MQKRILGKSGLEVSALGLGCMGLSFGYLHRLEENIASTEITLSTDDLKEINEAVSKIAVQGSRYNEQSQRLIDR